MQERCDLALLGNAYSKELHFFMELAQDVPINVPKVYGCYTDGSPQAAYFILVMEDLTTTILRTGGSVLQGGEESPRTP